MGEKMATANSSSKLGALLVLLRAFREARVPHARVPSDRISQRAVTVTSDFGVAPIFPGMR